MAGSWGQYSGNRERWRLAATQPRTRALFQDGFFGLPYLRITGTDLRHSAAQFVITQIQVADIQAALQTFQGETFWLRPWPWTPALWTRAPLAGRASRLGVTESLALRLTFFGLPAVGVDPSLHVHLADTLSIAQLYNAGVQNTLHPHLADEVLISLSSGALLAGQRWRGGKGILTGTVYDYL